MKALIEFHSGPEKGRQVWVEPGFTLGRRQGQVLISDPKVSSSHAEVAQAGHQLLLRDLGSTHGLWSPKEKVKSLPLQEGGLFKMGQTLFRVLKIEASPLEKALSEAQNALEKAKEPLPRELAVAFSQVVELEFLQGAHEGEVWPLGYGPRTFGTASLDLYVLDPEAKEECFTLESREGQVHVTCPHPDYVRVNESFVTDAPVKSGDVIGFGQTLIKVSMA